MMHRLRGFVQLVLAVALGVTPFAWSTTARAQDNPFDFGGETVEAGEKPAPEESLVEEAAAPTDAAAAAPALPPAARPATPAAAAEAQSLADHARRDPTLAAVLGLPRGTPAAKLRTVLTLISLGRADVAGSVLPELLQMPLDDRQRAALVREFGSATFIKLIRLDPPAAAEATSSPLVGLRDFAQKCLDAAATEARDPARVASLVAQLSAATPEERYAARVDLQESGEVGIVACCIALSQASSPEERGHIMAALLEMRPAVDEPLLAMLADATGQLEMDAADLAGRMRMAAAMPWLSVTAVSPKSGAAANAAKRALADLGLPAPTVPEVEVLLRQKMADVRTEPVNAIDEGTFGVWWSWDATARKLVAKEFAPKQLRTLAAARWCRALAEVSGLTDPGDARRAVIFELEEAALLGRPVSPALQPVIAGMTSAALSDALGEALAADYRPAAIALAGEIAARGDATVLATSSGRPSPLAAALTNPARDVRFAALAAILSLAPANSFPGSSQVAESLWYFASGAGQPAAVTAAPDLVTASDWAGQLRGAGFEATPVRTGREAMLAAVDRGVCSRLGVVILDSDIGKPLLGEVIFQLHAAEQTAGVPILVCSSGPRLATAQRLTARDPLVLVVPRPHREGDLIAMVEQARALAGRPFPPAEERMAQAAQAVTWIGQLLAAGGPYDELHRDAGLLSRTLPVRELTAPTLQALAAAGTSESQTILVDHVSVQASPIETRRAAATAFATSVQKFGLRLNRDDVLRQYDRYNASETADVETQKLLGQVLDVIERKTPAPQ